MASISDSSLQLVTLLLQVFYFTQFLSNQQQYNTLKTQYFNNFVFPFRKIVYYQISIAIIKIITVILNIFEKEREHAMTG